MQGVRVYGSCDIAPGPSSSDLDPYQQQQQQQFQHGCYNCYYQARSSNSSKGSRYGDRSKINIDPELSTTTATATSTKTIDTPDELFLHVPTTCPWAGSINAEEEEEEEEEATSNQRQPQPQLKSYDRDLRQLKRDSRKLNIRDYVNRVVYSKLFLIFYLMVLGLTIFLFVWTILRKGHEQEIEFTLVDGFITAMLVFEVLVFIFLEGKVYFRNCFNWVDFLAAAFCIAVFIIMLSIRDRAESSDRNAAGLLQYLLFALRAISLVLRSFSFFYVLIKIVKKHRQLKKIRLEAAAPLAIHTGTATVVSITTTTSTSTTSSSSSSTIATTPSSSDEHNSNNNNNNNNNNNVNTINISIEEEAKKQQQQQQQRRHGGSCYASENEAEEDDDDDDHEDAFVRVWVEAARKHPHSSPAPTPSRAISINFAKNNNNHDASNNGRRSIGSRRSLVLPASFGKCRRDIGADDDDDDDDDDSHGGGDD